MDIIVAQMIATGVLLFGFGAEVVLDQIEDAKQSLPVKERHS